MQIDRLKFGSVMHSDKAFGHVLAAIVAVVLLWGMPSLSWAIAADYTVGGTVIGLEGSGMILQNNSGDDLAIAADGSFIISTAVTDGKHLRRNRGNATFLAEPVV